MNQPTPIIVIEYMGREANPHDQNFGDMYSPYAKFEQSVKSYPCPSLANTEPGKTILARLLDAVDKGDSKIEVYDVKPLYGIRELGWKEIKVWVPIVEQKEGEEKLPHQTITEDEIKEWCNGTVSDFTLKRLFDIITGEYSLDEARKDILGFRDGCQ